jgi:peroxiredoxin Q/BCP
MTESQLATGGTAPDFTLNDADGKSVHLAEAAKAAQRGVVVYFYPKASTPGCTTEACDFRDNLASLQGAGYSVLGISADPAEDLVRFREEQHLTFTLLSDPGAQVAKSYASYGEKTFGGNTFEGTLRSTFVVDPDLKLIDVEYDVDPNGHVAQLRDRLGV